VPLLNRLYEATRDPKGLADAVGLYMVGKTQRAFRDQQRAGVAWAPRSVPNRIGILEDLRQGKTPSERRFEARPAAIDTGRLRSSIAYRVVGDTVVFGSNLPYASDVQRGSTKTVQIDGTIRAGLAAWLRSLSGDKKRQARAAMGWLFRAGSLTVTVPPRPFVAVDDDDRKAIRAMAAKFFGGEYLK